MATATSASDQSAHHSNTMGEEGALADGCMDDAIAVVGMACRFPGDATNVEAFWEMLRNGKDAWSEIPDDRFNAKGWYHPDPNRPGSFHIKGAHFIKDDIAAFDAPFFSISTAEAVSMDPQQRMLLEVVYEALDSAGIPMSSLANTATSVFCGSFVRDYEQPCMRDPDTTPPYSATGNGIAILANRISHAFDFAGTSQTIDTGCSASLIAVHQACKSLLSGESTVGIAAGVGLIFSPNTLVPMANLNILGADGRCYTFDQRASGYGRGEGTGVVVLKRLKDAVAANDTIRAVIRASASNQDGHTQGITLPSKERQIKNMTEVYRGAGLDITRTAYMECHGTGTQVGDVKETQAVTSVFCAHRTPDNPLMIGSVKTNIGHLEGSAGVAGLIKGILVVERGYIPKHLNFASPNPNIDFAGMRLKIAQELTPWPVPGLRRASVNSFGFGGTNAHVVLDDAPHFLAEAQIAGGHHSTFLFPSDQLQLNELYSFHGPRSHLFVLSGHDEAGLARVIASHAAYVATKTQEPAFETNYAYTLLNRRSRLNWRTFVVASSTADLLQKLEARTIAPPVRGAHSVPPRVGLVFCGQGAQWYAMGRELLGYHAFYASITSASWYLTSVLGSPFGLWDELHRAKDRSRIDEPCIAQPATTAIQVALVDLLLSAGLEPCAVVGHSSGEIAAAYAAGAITREDAWTIAYHRGQCVSRLETLAPCVRGGMLAVALSEDDARRGITEAGVSTVDVACINGPLSVTLSGDASGIATLQAYFRQKGCRATRVNVDTAYHSHHMGIIEDLYLDCIKGLAPCRPRSSTVYYSSVFGRAASACELGPEYWVRNLTCPVQFFSAVKAMMTHSRPDMLIEISPHRVWESAVHQIHAATRDGADAPGYVSLLRRNEDSSVTFFEALGDLWAKGHTISLDSVLTNSRGKQPRHLVDIPSYPWDHSKKYWHESHLSKTNRFRKHGREDIIGAPLENATPQDPRWRGFFRVQENPWLEDHVVQKSVLYPAGGLLAMAVEAAKQLADPHRPVLGYEVTDFQILKPMLIPSTPQGLENMLSARLVDDADNTKTAGSTSTAVYDFSILSKPTDGPWMTHAKGRFATVYCEDGVAPDASMEARFGTEARRAACHYGQARCHTQSDPRQFYEMLDVIGMTYGPQFRNLVAIETSDASAHTVVQVPDTRSRMPFQFEFDHVIHPATLDTMIQSVFALGGDGEAMLPCATGRVFVSAGLPTGAGARFRGYTTAEKDAARGATAHITMFDDALRAPAVIIERLQLKTVPSRAGSGSDRFLPAHRNLCSEIVWKQDVSSISALCAAVPTTLLSLVDLAAHKNPALAIRYHIPDAVMLSDSAGPPDSELYQLELVAETLKATNIVFDNLTAGYETPRFAQYTLSGVDAEKVWQHMRMLKDAHPGFERVQYAARVTDDAQYDLVLCSVIDTLAIDSLSAVLDTVSANGWLVLLAKLGVAIGREQYDTFRRALQGAGFRVDKVPAKSCVFLAAQKVTPKVAPKVAEVTPVSPITQVTLPIRGTAAGAQKIVFLLPDAPSDAVVALKEALRPVIKAQLSAQPQDLCLSALCAWDEQDRHTLVLSLVEMDSAVVIDMDQALYDGMHRLLTQTRGVLWLSHGAQIKSTCPKRAPFTGLARTLRSESSKKRILTLDVVDSLAHPGLDPHVPHGLVNAVAHVFKSLTGPRSPSETGEDVEFAYADGRLLIPRLMPLTLLNHAIEQGTADPHVVSQIPLLSGARALQLDAASLGSPEGPVFSEDTESMRRPLMSSEVRIAVSGTNLLPEDLLAATSGVSVRALATDVFGIVLETGSAVTGIQPGDHVSARMRDTPRTHVIADTSRVRRIKSAGPWKTKCPTALATAVYALHTARPISSGDYVLVYGALTVYGQAAIRVAASRGARVLVACASAAERTAMKAHFGIPASQILRLQDAGSTLEEQVMSLTQAHGADVVFDAASQHMEQAFRCVAECGRVVRVAQRGGGTMPRCCVPDKNASLETIDIGLLETRRPAEAQRLARDVDRLLQEAPKLDSVHGVLEYNMCDVQAALAHAAANAFVAPHVLYTQADVGPNKVGASIRLTHKVALSSTATYLLVGGLGGLGRSIAEHLVKRGARHLAFFSRSGACTPAAQALMTKLRMDGVQVAAFATDVCNETQLAATISEVHTFMPPIRGVIQCAGVVDDIVFPGMDYARWRRALAPKTTGAQNLHAQLPREMDFFVLLSSSSGVIGNRGQANYAAGNSFQDALARHRSAQGMHSVSIDLGLVLGAGMVAENEGLLDAMKASGFIGIRIHDVLFLLDRAMAPPGTEQSLKLPPQIVTTVGTGGLTIQNQPSDPFWTHTALFRYLNQVDAPPHGLNTGAGGRRGDQGLRALVQRAASVDDAAAVVSRALIATVARRKGMVSDDFDPHASLASYGIDSLDAIFVLGWIGRETGVTVQTVEGPSILELSRDIAKRTLEAAALE